MRALGASDQSGGGLSTTKKNEYEPGGKGSRHEQ